MRATASCHEGRSAWSSIDESEALGTEVSGIRGGTENIKWSTMRGLLFRLGRSVTTPFHSANEVVAFEPSSQNKSSCWRLCLWGQLEQLNLDSQKGTLGRFFGKVRPAKMRNKSPSTRWSSKRRGKCWRDKNKTNTTSAGLWRSFKGTLASPVPRHDSTHSHRQCHDAAKAMGARFGNA